MKAEVEGGGVKSGGVEKEAAPSSSLSSPQQQQQIPPPHPLLQQSSSLSSTSFYHGDNEDNDDPENNQRPPFLKDSMAIFQNNNGSSSQTSPGARFLSDNEEHFSHNSPSPTKRGSRLSSTLNKLHLRHPHSTGKRDSGAYGADVGKHNELGLEAGTSYRHSMDGETFLSTGRKGESKGSKGSSGKHTPSQKEATGDFADFLQAEELKAALAKEQEKAIKRDLKAAKHPKRLKDSTIGGKGKPQSPGDRFRQQKEEEDRQKAMYATEGPTLEERGYFPGDLRHHNHLGPTSRPTSRNNNKKQTPQRFKAPGICGDVSDSDAGTSEYSDEGNFTSPQKGKERSLYDDDSESDDSNEILPQVINPSVRSLKSWQSGESDGMGSLASGGANPKLSKPLLELEELELDSFLKNFGRHTREIRVPNSANFPRKRMPRWEDFKVPPGEAALAAAQGKRITVLTHVDRGLQILAASEGQGTLPTKPLANASDLPKGSKKDKLGEDQHHLESKKGSVANALKVTFAPGTTHNDDHDNKHHQQQNHRGDKPPSPHMPFAGLNHRSIEQDEREAKRLDKEAAKKGGQSIVNVQDDDRDYRPSRDEADMDLDEWELLNADADGDEKDLPEDEKVDGIAWAIASILALVERYAPEELDNSPDQAYREGKTRSHIERLYLIAPFWQRLLAGIRGVYRWENPSKTSSIMMIYFTLWYMDLIPTAFGCILMYYVCQFRFFPPSASYLHEQVRFRMARGVDADRLAERLRRRSRLDVLEVYKRFVVAYGEGTQLACGDIADFHEKVKNLILWRNTTATWRTLTLLAVVTFFVTFVSSHYIWKTIFLFLGFTFFILLPLQSHYPRFRRPLSPIWWALWGSPTDAQFAIQLLRRRHLEKQRLKHPDDMNEVLTDNRGVEGGKSSATEDRLNSGESKGAMNVIKRRMLGPTAAHAVAYGSMRPLGEDEGGLSDLRDTKILDGQITSKPRKLGSFFCQHHGVPGHLHVNTNMLYFVALHSHVNKEGKGKKVCKTLLSDITGLVKTKSIQLFIWSSSGLQVARKNKSSLFFSNMPHRDNAFNLLLAVGSEGEFYRVDWSGTVADKLSLPQSGTKFDVIAISCLASTGM
jgi:hypothetical protein